MIVVCRLRQHSTKVHVGQDRNHWLRQPGYSLDLGLLVKHRRAFIQMRQGCFHPRSLLLSLFQLRLLLLRRTTNGGEVLCVHRVTVVTVLTIWRVRAGEREADEKKEAAGGTGAAAAAAIAAAGAVLRSRKRVNVRDVEQQQHGGNQDEPKGRGVEPRLRRQAQRDYTGANRHLPGCDGVLHRGGSVDSAQVGRLVVRG